MRVAVVGAGVGGLAAGVRLAALGHRVAVLEAGARAGRQVRARRARRLRAGTPGPSLLTMPWVLEALFADTGAPLADELELLPVEPVTRYRFADGTRLRPLGRPGALARGARGVAARARAPSGTAFLATCAAMWRGVGAGARGPGAVAAAASRRRPARGRRRSTSLRVKPWWTLRGLARAHTRDPRLRMVIERFATYAGADPRRAPAALAVAGYVEHAWGAWHPRGGLYALVEALVRRLEALGGELRLGTAGAPDRARAAARAAARPPRVAGVETDAGAGRRRRGRRRRRRRGGAPRPARPAAARRASARSPASR